LDGDEEDQEQRPFPTLPEPRYSRSLERGLAILACFTPERPVLGIAEVADMLGMSRPTTHRYMSTLVAQGYLRREARKYRLGLGTVELGMTTLGAMGLCNHARADLQALARDSGQTAEMAVLDGLEILVLDAIGASRQAQATGATEVLAGSRLPVYCTSMGKVLLAHLPEARLTQLLAELDLLKQGPKTITSAVTLRAQLARIREEGWAVNDEERLAGCCAIAAPIRDESGDVLAAVSVVSYSAALDVEDLLERYAGRLVASADRISTRLGWRRDQDGPERG
jgi:IclR family pca regulon transcriptional regulator